MGIRSACGKTRREGVKNEKVMINPGWNINLSNWYKNVYGSGLVI